MGDGKKKEQARPDKTRILKIRGIGGWLVLVQVYLAFSVISSILIVIANITNDEEITILLTVFAAAFSIAGVICVVQFIRRKMTFRILFIITAIIFLTYYSISLTQYIKVNDDYYRLIVAAVIYAIVIVALFKSERVKNTFS